MGRALVLNASYQPLCVVSARRAIVLVLKSKAVIEQPADEGFFSSEKVTLPVPSVVRLVYFVKVPYRARASLSRRAVFVRDNFQCQYCGSAAENVDHIKPRSKGGTHTWDNVVASCRPCNARKENLLLAETGMTLRRPPHAPKDSLFLIAAAGKIHPAWEPYLSMSPGASEPEDSQLASTG
ncbi:MAG TPA: HNH endonuclease [Actinomycetota bacterium]|nr:HNH endonuclease [Actinomycetota bacterium]